MYFWPGYQIHFFLGIHFGRGLKTEKNGMLFVSRYALFLRSTVKYAPDMLSIFYAGLLHGN